MSYVQAQEISKEIIDGKRNTIDQQILTLPDRTKTVGRKQIYNPNSMGLKNLMTHKKSKTNKRSRWPIEMDNLSNTSYDSAADYSIDQIFPKTIEQHSDRYSFKNKSKRKSSDEEKYTDQKSTSCCTSLGQFFVYLFWPVWWILYHMFCCCLCQKKNSDRED